MPEFNLAEELGRKMPFSAEAEQSVLGSVLIDPECFNRLPGIISESDFYLEEHRAIYAAMQKLFVENKTIDPVTLADALVRESGSDGRHVFDADEAQRYVRLIAETVPSAANATDYARIVRDNSKLRRLIEVCGEITSDAFAHSERTDVIIGKAEQLIFEISQDIDSREFVHIQDVLRATMMNLQIMSTEGRDRNDLKTGFSCVDNILVGMEKGDLVFVGARPGVGKTSFALNIATQVARSFLNSPEDRDKCVCIFSLEMSREQIAARMLSSEALVNSKALREVKLKDEDWPKLAKAAEFLYGCKIYIDDSSDVTVSAMKSKLRRLRSKPGLIIVDYLQLMHSDRRTENRVTEVADISRNLKIMAKDMGCPIIALSQLSRGPEEKGKGRRPVLSDLRESGSIEQDADIVIFLFRPEMYEQTPENHNLVEVIVAKNRHGETRTAEMNWSGEFTKFTVREERELDAPPY